MPWLISYQYSARFKHANGGSRGNAPIDTIQAFDTSPAQFMIDARMKLNELEDTPYDVSRGPQRADEILRIYSAVEIDDNSYATLCDIM